ncbi:MAG: aminotransferase class IV [Candidatus Paceibacterota bacterium]|jgi:branched-subunit amino acid aminotransferase/4-amino-4-deoxychorismate lyase|nr:aminotransferase class IV [Candidatus Paceibacterota bacterium]
MSFKYYSKNCEIRPIEQAVVSLERIEYTYGFGVYEAIRVSNGIVYFLEHHIERLLGSALIIGLEHNFSGEKLQKAVLDLVKITDEKTYNLKVLLIGGPKKEDAFLSILCFHPFFPDKKMYRDGVDLSVTYYERLYPHAKTLNMLQSYLSYRDARGKNCYDSALIDRNGCITEGTRTNFFTIKGNTIYTPRESQILLGVTRKAVLHVALQNGFTVEEKDIRPEDLKDYDGVFLTSTSSKIVPIRKVGDIVCPPTSEELKRLMKLFGDFLDESNGVL